MRVNSAPCHFCEMDGAVIGCDWRVDKPETITAADVWVGAQLQYVSGGWAVVKSVEPGPRTDSVRVTIRKKAGEELTAVWPNWGRIVAIVNAPCAARCCETCAQERSEKFHCCPVHYTALEVSA